MKILASCAIEYLKYAFGNDTIVCNVTNTRNSNNTITKYKTTFYDIVKFF